MTKHQTIGKEVVKKVKNVEPEEAQAIKMKQVYEKKQAPAPKESVGKAATLRERILALSLFPNITNQVYMYGSH